MKVKDLIKELQKLPENSEVVYEYTSYNGVDDTCGFPEKGSIDKIIIDKKTNEVVLKYW